jgi:ABC-type branched-subunit amino acid transport system ATPase component
VLFDGEDVTRLSPDARARMGLIRSFQNVRLFPSLTVRENIAVAYERRGETRSVVLAAMWAPALRRTERRIAQRADNLIDSLGLVAYADKFLGELSTGSRRIAEIACLLASGPRLLLLDEPSSGLAQAETEALGPLIARIVKEAGCGVVVIEHDLALVSAVSQRLVFMELGRVVRDGRPDEVLADPRVQTSYAGGTEPAAVSAAR